MVLNYTPNVQVNEIDKSLTVQNLAASNVGLVIAANWGPCNQIVQIANEARLKDQFDKPEIENFVKLVVADASSFTEGGVVSNATGAVGFIDTLDSVNNTLYVKRVTGGSFAASDNLDSADPYVGAETTCTSESLIPSNKLSWMVAADFANNYANTGHVVRCITNTEGESANSVLFINSNAEVTKGWDVSGTDDNGTNQLLRINDDDAEASPDFINLTKLTVADSSVFSEGGDISSDNVSPGAAKVFRITDATTVYIKDVTGTFANGDNLDDTAVYAAPATTLTTNDGDADQVLCFYAKYPGKAGNRVKVAVTDSTQFATAVITGSTTFLSEFDSTPTSTELAIAVLFDDEIKEKWIVSKTEGALNFENELYFIEDFLANKSAYIYAKTSTTGNKTFSDFAGTFTATELAGGCSAFLLADVQTAYDVIYDDEEYDIRLPGDFHDMVKADVQTSQGYMKTQAETTKKHLNVLVLPNDVFNMASFSIGDVTTYMAGFTGSSYTAVYDNWKKVYDKYNKKRYFIPCTADALGVIVNTIENFAVWSAPFGNQKGLIQNVEKLYHKTDAETRDLLYKNGVNSIFFKRGKGYLIWGQKTTYNPASSRSRINVRLNLMDMEIAIEQLLDDYISEESNAATWRSIRNTVDEGYLKPRDGKGAFDNANGPGYRFICDETNNTPDVIDAYKIVCDFAVKPIKSAEIIELNVIITSSGVNLEEI